MGAEQGRPLPHAPLVSQVWYVLLGLAFASCLGSLGPELVLACSRGEGSCDSGGRLLSLRIELARQVFQVTGFQWALDHTS